MKTDIELSEFQASVEATSLKICYRVENHSARRIYLVNRLFKRGPQGREVQANFAYLRQESGLVIIEKGAQPVPDHIDVEVPEVPYLTSIEPKTSHRECFTLALPLVATQAYGMPVPTKLSAKTIQLRIGWTEQIEAKSMDVGGETVLWAYPTTVLRAQNWLSASPTTVRLPE